jgi:tRNA nucleotidyltransferase/poly(A) polymerase
VRDELLGRTPTDYDVATDARPDEIRRLFGHRRTIAVGAAFGVIAVIGPASAGNVEVATFRRDAAYSDGRHPDRVTFSDARDDAERRDFTVNGLFLDPVSGEVLDYVGGQEDLRRKIIRAIGDPHQRIAEDKLRMLRAVRFAAALGWQIDEATEAAIAEHAPEISQISPERIADELRKMLAAPSRADAVGLLEKLNLLAVVLPEVHSLVGRRTLWTESLEVLRRLQHEDFALALAVLLGAAGADRSVIEGLGRRLRLSNREIADMDYYTSAMAPLAEADSLPWSIVQPVLADDRAARAVDLAAAVAAVRRAPTRAMEFCRERLDWPRERLDPPPLITGDDLRDAGIRPGPRYSLILRTVRAAQLDGQISSHQEALDLAQRTG